MTLLSGGRYYGGGSLLSGVVTIGGLLLSGGLLLRVIVTIGGLLLSGGRYYQGSLLSGGRYYRGLLHSGVVAIGGRYYRGVVTIGEPLLSEFYGSYVKMIKKFNHLIKKALILFWDGLFIELSLS